MKNTFGTEIGMHRILYISLSWHGHIYYVYLQLFCTVLGLRLHQGKAPSLNVEFTCSIVINRQLQPQQQCSIKSYFQPLNTT